MPKNILMLRIAGFRIRLHFPTTQSQYINNYLKHEIEMNLADYTDSNLAAEPDFSVEFRFMPMVDLMIKSRFDFYSPFYRYDQQRNQILSYHYIGFFQFYQILNLILTNLLAKSGGFMIHGSAVTKDDKAYVFLGPSGAGKSTIARLLDNEYRQIADDTLIIVKRVNRYYVYPAPFIEKKKFNNEFNDKNIYLHGIFFLKKSKKNSVKQIYDINRYTDLFIKQQFIHEANLKAQITNTLALFKYCHSIYELSFSNKDRGVLLRFFNSFLNDQIHSRKHR